MSWMAATTPVRPKNAAAAHPIQEPDLPIQMPVAAKPIDLSPSQSARDLLPLNSTSCSMTTGVPTTWRQLRKAVRARPYASRRHVPGRVVLNVAKPGDVWMIVSGRYSHSPDRPCPSLCQMVTKGEDKQRVEDVQRSQPPRIELRIGEERLHKHEQEENHRQSEDIPPHSADDRGDEHQDRYEVQDDEAPLPVGIEAFAAEDTKASEEELDRNSENKQPSQPDEELARYIH